MNYESIGYGVVNVLLVLLLAPLYEGVLRKVTARIQSRQGPPLLQPYYDLMKLLGKEDIEAGQSPLMQRFAACLSLAAILMVAVLVPMGTVAAPMSGAGDSILLIYLLTLAGISVLLAGLAAGSTYSLIGISREMMAMMTLEPLLAIAVVVGAVKCGSLQLGEVLNGSVYACADASKTVGTCPAAGMLMLLVVLFALQALVGRVPFDTSEAETEIMEGPLAEYSGPKLALFKYVRMAKLIVYGSIFIALFVPWGNTIFYPLNVVILLAKLFVLVLGITFVAATGARYRIDQAVRYYIGLFGVAMAALVLAVLGW